MGNATINNSQHGLLRSAFPFKFASMSANFREIQSSPLLWMSSLFGGVCFVDVLSQTCGGWLRASVWHMHLTFMLTVDPIFSRDELSNDSGGVTDMHGCTNISKSCTVACLP